MARSKARKKKRGAKALRLRTPLLVRELADGCCVCYPVADPELASFGDPDSALLEQRMFLEAYLPQQPAEVMARFALPESCALHAVDVPLERDDLGRELPLGAPVTVCCLTIEQRRDRWVVVFPLHHTFHTTLKEDLEAAVVAEVQRMVAAAAPTPLEFAELLPPEAYRLEWLELAIDRSDQRASGRAKGLRRRVADKRREKRSREILASVATPLTPDAMRGEPPLQGRQAELAQLGQLLGSKERLGVLLIGEALAGKTALLRGWLRDRPRRGRGPLVYGTSGAQLVAGMSGLGQWQERVRRVMEAAEQLDAVVFFDDLGELLGDKTGGYVDIAGALRPYVEQRRVRVVCEARPAQLDRFEHSHAALLGELQRVRVDPLDAEQTTALLRERVAHQRRAEGQRPTLGADAVQPLVDLVDRYRPYDAYPGKAVRLLEELRAVFEQQQLARPDATEIDAAQLYATFALQTGVPEFLLRGDRSLKREQITRFFGRRLIGQREAIDRVADVICVVKAALQPAEKPLASFVFIGPTGVGKTELARCLAAFLFGDEQRLIRFDMSEFSDAAAAERLIRGGADRDEGRLTRRVRQQPFSVVLLDEIEKAHPAVFDLLLQVLGEGRLTDAGGRTTYFNNAIVIMTSNLGAAQRRDPIGVVAQAGSSGRYYLDQVDRNFRPEFVNRIDRVVAFEPLARAEIREVATLALASLARRRGFSELGGCLTVSPAALERLAAAGFSAEYGARSLRRHLEDQLVTPAAHLLAELGAKARGAAIAVHDEDEPLATPRRGLLAERSAAGGLRFRATRGEKRQRGKGSALQQIAVARRQLGRCLEIEGVAEVRDHLQYLVTELARSSGQRASGASGATQASMQREHGRLQELWDAAESCRRELEEAEDLSLVAFAEGEDILPYLEESERLTGRFMRALCYLLVARRRDRDQVTLMVQRLESSSPVFELWLRLLLDSCEARRWLLTAHVDGDRSLGDEAWPAERRFGPPRTAEWLAGQLDGARAAPIKSVLLRVRGPYAGALLALEDGVHRFHGADGQRSRHHLAVEHVAQRSELLDEEWMMTPRPTTAFPQLRRQTMVREVDLAAQTVTIRRPGYEQPTGEPCLRHHPVDSKGDLLLDLPPERYFADYEQVAARALLLSVGEAFDVRDDLYGGRRAPRPGGRG